MNTNTVHAHTTHVHGAHPHVMHDHVMDARTGHALKFFLTDNWSSCAEAQNQKNCQFYSEYDL